MSDPASISPSDLWTFLLCTIRYSMGRRSYMPSECGDLLAKYKSHLTRDQLVQIYSEIKTELIRAEEQKRFLGDLIDHKTWKNLLEKIDKWVRTQNRPKSTLKRLE